MEKDKKLLNAAVVILTTSEFNFKGKKIDGTKKTQDDIMELLKELADDIDCEVNKK